MRDLLYINDQLVDLDPKTVIATTVKAIEVAQLDSRELTHTNQVTVPRTENNDLIFGWAGDEKSTTSKPYQLLPCKLVQSGIETIPRGTCIIKSFNDGYRINIVEEMYDIFASLEGKQLKDIDPIPDSNWDAVAMDNARDNTEGIISAILYWGTAVFDDGFFLPCFFYHTIITAILEHTGVTVSGDILSDSRLTDLVMPFCGDTFDAPPSLTEPAPSFDDKGSVGTSDSSTDVTASPPTGAVGDLLLMLAMSQQGGGSINTPSGYTLVDAGNFNTSAPAAAGTAGVWYRIVDGTEASFTLTRTGSTGSFCVQFYLFSAGTNVTIESEATKSDGDGNSTITYSTVTVNGSRRTLIALIAQLDSSNPGTPSGYVESASDTVDAGPIQIALECNTKEDVTSDGSVTSTGGSGNGWITFHLAIYNNEDLNVDWNLYWPDVDVKDLLRDFFTRFSIIPKQRQGILYLKSIEDIIADRDNVMDWSGKLVKGKRPIDFSLNYAQNNNFDYVNTQNDATMGRGVMEVANETLPFEATKFTSIFEQCAEYNSGGYQMASIPVFTDESTNVTDFKDTPGIKLLTLKARTTETAITFFATARTDYKLAYFLDTDLSKDTNWQYFLDEFYPRFTLALQKNKVITKEYLLTPLDIRNYDSHKMMYDGDGYYIINKISNFVNEGNAGSVTKVELFRVK